METRPLGNTGFRVAPLALGGNVFGWTADEKTSFAVLDAFVAGGFTLIDTANSYSRWVSGHQGGEFYRKIDRSRVSKVPNQTGTYDVTTMEANFPFGEGVPAFGGRFSIDEPAGLPVRIETRGLVDDSEIPAECTQDWP